MESGFAVAAGEGVGVAEGVAVASETLTDEVAATETWKCDDSVGLMTAEDAAACCWTSVGFSPGKFMFELGVVVGVGLGPEAVLLLLLLSCCPMFSKSMMP